MRILNYLNSMNAEEVIANCAFLVVHLDTPVRCVCVTTTNV